jgi:hypothetical protein
MTTTASTTEEARARVIAWDLRRAVAIAQSALESLVTIRRTCDDARAQVEAGADSMQVSRRLDASIYLEMQEVELFVGDLSPIVAPLSRSIPRAIELCATHGSIGWAEEVARSLDDAVERLTSVRESVRSERRALAVWIPTFPQAAEQLERALGSCEVMIALITQLLG